MGKAAPGEGCPPARERWRHKGIRQPATPCALLRAHPQFHLLGRHFAELAQKLCIRKPESGCRMGLARPAQQSETSGMPLAGVLHMPRALAQAPRTLTRAQAPRGHHWTQSMAPARGAGCAPAVSGPSPLHGGACAVLARSRVL